MSTKLPYIILDNLSDRIAYKPEYIVKLCKDGDLDCAHISHSWFVSEESLREYLSTHGKKADFDVDNKDYVYISESVGGASSIFIDNKEYIDVSVAENITGYSRDYITQLAREEAVEGRKIARAWFVEKDSLLRHKNMNLSDNDNANRKKAKYTYKTEELTEEIPRIDTVGKNTEGNDIKQDKKHIVKIHKVYKVFSDINKQENETERVTDELPDPNINSSSFENNETKNKNEISSNDNVHTDTLTDIESNIINIDISESYEEKPEIKSKATKINIPRFITVLNLVLMIILAVYIALIKSGLISSYSILTFSF